MTPAAISLNSSPKLWQEPPHSPEDTCRWISALHGPLESPMCCEPLEMSRSGPDAPELNSWAPCSLSPLCSTGASEHEEPAWGARGAPDARQTLALEGGHGAGLPRARAPQGAGTPGPENRGLRPPPRKWSGEHKRVTTGRQRSSSISPPIWGRFSPAQPEETGTPPADISPSLPISAASRSGLPGTQGKDLGIVFSSYFSRVPPFPDLGTGF